ncbi:MAG: acyl-ACP--UDP-N-acetylglucosamine O-acyltransferase [Pseudomonadota bacterium]
MTPGADIDPLARVHPGAVIGEGTTVGAFAVIGPQVKIGRHCKIGASSVVDGHTAIGDGTEVFPFASIGLPPQDLKYKGEPSTLTIGSDCLIREGVTINPGTEGGGMVTRVGNRCLFMVGAHVAHDCQIGDHVIMANNATLGGHVVIEEHAIIGGLSAVHQFVRIGRHAIVGGMSGVEHDLIPYAMAMGDRARLHGLNVVGLKRHGFDRGQIQILNTAYQMLFADSDTLTERVDRVAAELGTDKGVQDIVAFVRAGSTRALCRPKPGDGG